MNEEYQEIDLLKLAKVVVAKWWLILILMVIAGGTAYYVTMEYVTPIYEAKSTLFIGKENDSLTGIDLNDLKVENQLIVDYRELIRTNLVTEEVISELSLLATPEELVSNLGISSIDESRFMHITYTDHLPQRAAEITNHLSLVLSEKAVEVVGVEYIRIVDKAKVPSNPTSPSKLKNSAIASVLGAMIGLGIIFLLHMMDNKIRSEEDIEAILNEPVLGMIPLFEGEVRE